MASYDAEIRVQTSIDNKNFIAGADKVQHTLKDIEKEVDVAKSKLKDLETLGIPKNSKHVSVCRERPCQVDGGT